MVSSHKNLFNLITSKKVTKQILNKIFHFFTIKLTHSGSLPGQPGSRLVWSVGWLDNINTFQHAFFPLLLIYFPARTHGRLREKWPTSPASQSVQRVKCNILACTSSAEKIESRQTVERREGNKKTEHHIHT